MLFSRLQKVPIERVIPMFGNAIFLYNDRYKKNYDRCHWVSWASNSHASYHSTSSLFTYLYKNVLLHDFSK